MRSGFQLRADFRVQNWIELADALGHVCVFGDLVARRRSTLAQRTRACPHLPLAAQYGNFMNTA